MAVMVAVVESSVLLWMVCAALVHNTVAHQTLNAQWSLLSIHHESSVAHLVIINRLVAASPLNQLATAMDTISTAIQ